MDIRFTFEDWLGLDCWGEIERDGKGMVGVGINRKAHSQEKISISA